MSLYGSVKTKILPIVDRMKRGLFFGAKVIAALIIVLFMLTMGAFILGMARWIQSMFLWAEKGKQHLTSDHEIYQREISHLQHVGRVLLIIAKIVFFPVTLWTLGLNYMVGYLVYPKTHLNPFKPLVAPSYKPPPIIKLSENPHWSEKYKYSGKGPIYMIERTQLYYLDEDDKLSIISHNMNKKMVDYFSKHPNIVQSPSASDLAMIKRETGYESRPMPLVSVNTDEFDVSEFMVTMPNQVQLRTCEIGLKGIPDTPDRPHHIYFGGNAASIDNYASLMTADARELDVKVIGFDHSSYGRSGRILENGHRWYVPTLSYNRLLDEGIAQVQRLLSKGVPAEKITLYGHSLGGTIATGVAWYFHSQKVPQRIRIFSDRSLTSPLAMVMGYLLPKHISSSDFDRFLTLRDRLRIALAYMLKPIIKGLIMLSGWDFDATVFAKIPSEYRDYIVVRGRDEDEDEPIDDEVIPYGASTHMNPTIKAEYKAWKITQSRSASSNPHKFFKGKTYDSNEDTPRMLHCIPLSDLVQDDGTSGLDYWQNFARSQPT